MDSALTSLCNNNKSPTMTTPSKSTLQQIPTGIWVLGFVSMLMDISSEMIHSLLPMFMVTTLGASVFAVGLIEGVSIKVPRVTCT